MIEAPPGLVYVLGVRFYPAGAYAVLGRPLHDVSERVVNLEDVIGDAASELAERCGDTRDPGLRLECATRWISERLVRSPGIDPRVAWVAAQIEASHGNASIAGLRHRAGLSKERLVALFREQIGLAPKRYARVVRFRRALSLLHGGGYSLAEVATTVGYHDQPHMNRDFRELGALAPGEFLGMMRYSATTTIG
jgi:transcriptional regulator GlxA family with amidase domain